MKILHENINLEEFENEDEITEEHLFIKRIPNNLKIGLVVPQQSLRKTLRKVFKYIKGLSPKMVISPNDVVKKKYDILIVDEAHRLRQRKGLSQYPIFDKNNKALGLGENGTELDWIVKNSRIQIFFYDPLQSVKPSDIDRKVFTNLFLSNETNESLELISQLRCLGGNDDIEYIKNILYSKQSNKKEIENYDLRFFDNVNDMVQEIKKRNEEYDLSRVVAGYSWKWNSKKDKSKKDIFIDEYAYIWNSTDKDWVNSKNAIDEIGSIHTVQGYDLNYIGVIFGREIDYNFETNQIEVKKSLYEDNLGKANKTDESLREYIINIYLTLLTRGIRGAYIYAYNENLRKYLKEFFS